MKKFISLLILSCFVINSAFADCNWSAIKPMPNGSYEYSPALHLCVGQLVEDSKTKDKQIQDLTQAISLKDLALTKSDARTQLWMDTSFKLEDNLTKVQNLQSGNNALYFGLGIAATVLSVFVASKAIGH